MKKRGTAMLLTTLILNAFAASPTVEAQMLSNNNNLTEKKGFSTDDELVTNALESRKSELEDVLSSFRVYYAEISAKGGEVSSEEFKELELLELSIRAEAEYLKMGLQRNAKAIIDLYGENVFFEFRHVVAIYGQIRKNVSNILAFYSEEMGVVEVLSDNAFTPTSDFFKAAFVASKEVYGTH